MLVKSVVAVCLILPSSAGAQPSVEVDVVFGTYSGLALLMDVHKPATSNGYGIVVIPGSGWHRGLGYDAVMLKQSRELSAATSKLVGAGYTAFVINHRAAPRFHYQDALDDVQRAVRFIRFNRIRYALRSDRMGALGGSSGGHLVSLLGTLDGKGDAEASDPIQRESSKVQAVVTVYPATDLTKFESPIR
jgi:acetyl esterase/lipase